MTDRQEHIFTWVAVVVVLLYATGWVGAIAELRRRATEPSAFGAPPSPERAATASPSAAITGQIFGPEAPKTAYLTDAMLAFLHPLRGESGEVRYRPVLPGEKIAEAPGGAAATIEGTPSPDFTAPDKAGIYKFAVEMNRATRAVDNVSIVTLVPLSAKRGGRIGPYYLGNWPFEGGGTPKTERYAAPAGFIEVTQQNQNFQVSEHFRLRDFLTKDQPNVWPKYMPLDPKLIDKLELTIQELEKKGIRVEHVQIMSGFRTPRYNHSGGNTEGRANLSRHMYGDASDIFVDNDRNGSMDDLNHDGRSDTRDAEVVAQAAERVEGQHRSLVGGIGVYSACCGHGPFVHIDVRGFRARWRGTGNG
ncbi:MAG TPA: DUF882 domain-containing protein [Thermoanaerobaculia bacterium]|nr:DUF882 domain-containing protein [Thermoanaerobaculia bacterium]